MRVQARVSAAPPISKRRYSRFERTTAPASLSPAELSVMWQNISALALGDDTAPRDCLPRHGATPHREAAARRRIRARGGVIIFECISGVYFVCFRNADQGCTQSAMPVRGSRSFHLTEALPVHNIHNRVSISCLF